MEFIFSFFTFADNILVQALLAFPLILSMVISYRCLRIPDVTIDGASVLASSVCVVLMRYCGVCLPLAIIIAVLAAFFSGLITGVLIEIFRINSLLTGILNAFILYSISLLLINASMDFEKNGTLFSWVKQQDIAFSQQLPSTLVIHPYLLCLLIIIAVSLKTFVDWFLRREWGVVLRGSSSNELVLQLRGINTKRIRILGFGISNALVGLGGTLISMYEGSVQAMRWPGTIIFALSVAIIGWETSRQISRKIHIRLNDSTGIILGALMYYIIVRACYTFNVPTSLPRLVIAVYIVLILAEKRGALRRFRELFW